MRILINATSARQGGGGTYIINLLNHLPEEVEIFIYAPDSLPIPNVERVTRLTTYWSTDNPILRSIWERMVLPIKIKLLKADVLFCPGGVLNTSVSGQCISVTMFRNMMPFDITVRKKIPSHLQKIRNRILEKVLLRSMAAADLVIFISAHARLFIEEKIALKSSTTIPHGISKDFRTYESPPPRPSNVTQDQYILYVSRFDVYKHHHEVVRAYALLPENLRRTYKLLLVGEADSGIAEQVRVLIAELNLTNNVIIAGKVDYRNLPAVYHYSSLVIFASSCENCPNILLEALGAGKPIVCSSIPPMPEFGRDAVMYVDPRDPVDIATKIEDMLTVPGNLEAFAQRARVESGKYDWKRSAEKTWEEIIKCYTNISSQR